MSNTGGQDNLSLTLIKEFPILLPPLKEQKVIADLLATWDKAICAVRRLIDLKIDKKAFELSKLITQHKANTSLGAFIRYVERKINKPNEPYWTLGIKSHFKGTFQRKVDDFQTVQMDYLFKVKENDLIVNITFAWEGAISLVKREDERAYVSHRFPTYEILTEKASPRFIHQLIATKRMKYELTNISPGGAGRNRVLNKKDFLKLHVWLPSIEKQNIIGGCLATLDREIEQLTLLCNKYINQRYGLMQKLLTQDLYPKPTNNKNVYQ